MTKKCICFLVLLLLTGCAAQSSEQMVKPDIFSTSGVKPVVDGTFQTDDGKMIAYSFYEKQDSHFGVVLVHMLDRDRHDWDSFARELQAAGYSVISIDSRGHGESTPDWRWRSFSEPQFKTMTLDVKAAVNFLASKNVQNVILIGASIGANTVLNYGVADKVVKAIVLLSPGLDYRGVRVLDAANENFKPLMVVASKADLYAWTSSQEIIKASLSEVEDEQYYENAGHGTDMFKKEKVDGVILKWLIENKLR